MSILYKNYSVSYNILKTNWLFPQSKTFLILNPSKKNIAKKVSAWTHLKTQLQASYIKHQEMYAWVLSHIRLLVTPQTVAHQVPLSMELSRQEYRSGLPFPSPGDLPNPGTEPTFPALAQILYHWATGEDGVLLTSHSAKDRPHNKCLSRLNVRCAKAEKPWYKDFVGYKKPDLKREIKR